MDKVLLLLSQKKFSKEECNINDRNFDLIRAVLSPEITFKKNTTVVYFNNLSYDAHFGANWSVYEAVNWDPFLVGENMVRILSKHDSIINEDEMVKLIESYPNEIYPIIFKDPQTSKIINNF